MTLILTAAFNRAAVQVSDRLVTLQGSGRQHDPVANKSVICQTSDGLFAFGYSGPAYVGDVTTDSWLAANLWGGELPGPGFISGGSRARVVDIGMSLHRLRDALQEMTRNQPRLSHPSCYIVAAGVQASQPSRPPRIAAYEITDRSTSGPRDFVISKAEREIPKGKFALLQNPHGLWPQEQQELRGELRNAASVDDVEDALVNTIRIVANRNPAVGSDCMSVAIAAMLEPNTRVRFIPATPHDGVLGEGQLVGQTGIHGQWRGTRVQTGFSPYILGVRSIQSPQVLIGSGILTLGGISVRLEAPEPGGPNVGASTQARPPRP